MELDLKRLKAERIANGLTQEDVAKAFGKTRAWYAKRENGFIPIGADELAKLAELFNVEISKIAIFFAKTVPEKEQNYKKQNEENEAV